MISTNQMAYFERSAVFLKMSKSFSLLSVALHHDFNQSDSVHLTQCIIFEDDEIVQPTFSRLKVTIDWSINIISTIHELSDPSWDSVNRCFTLVRLMHKTFFYVMPYNLRSCRF